MSAWIDQRDKAWVVYWLEDGHQRQKSCGTGQAGRVLAKKLQAQINAELVLEKKPLTTFVPWADFVLEYRAKVLELASSSHQRAVLMSLENFQRIVRPTVVSKITSRDLDTFKAKRAKERNRQFKKLEKPVSPASVNLDLRNVKAALKYAKRWDYLENVPEVEPIREPERLPTPIPLETFWRLYEACDQMTLPRQAPAAWWRALLVMALMSGWRKGELLGLERIDLDLENGQAVIRHGSSKGKRDEIVPLYPWAVEHLQGLVGFSRRVLEWPHNQRTFTAHWHKLQRLAGLETRYKFHAFRSSFCSHTAAGLSLVARQFLARHKSSSTTARHYVNPTDEVARAVSLLRDPRQDSARLKGSASVAPDSGRVEITGFLEESA